MAQRLTLIRIFEEVRALGYDGGYDAVRRYARTWSTARGAAVAEAYVPLWYAPGEAYQFDWSHEVVVIGGVTVTVIRQDGAVVGEHARAFGRGEREPGTGCAVTLRRVSANA